MFRVFVGWDRREAIAYDVARHSLLRRASIPVSIAPIKLDELRRRGLYWRDQDPLASTEFTYSRFLTPVLAGFKGWALFCDCDFLWLGDVGGLLDTSKGWTLNIPMPTESGAATRAISNQQTVPAEPAKPVTLAARE